MFFCTSTYGCAPPFGRSLAIGYHTKHRWCFQEGRASPAPTYENGDTRITRLSRCHRYVGAGRTALPSEAGVAGCCLPSDKATTPDGGRTTPAADRPPPKRLRLAGGVRSAPTYTGVSLRPCVDCDRPCYALLSTITHTRYGRTKLSSVSHSQVPCVREPSSDAPRRNTERFESGVHDGASRYNA